MGGSSSGATSFNTPTGKLNVPATPAGGYGSVEKGWTQQQLNNLSNIGPTFNQLNPNIAPSVAQQMNPVNPGASVLPPPPIAVANNPPTNPSNGPIGGTDIPPPFFPPNPGQNYDPPAPPKPPPPPVYVPHATVAAGPQYSGQGAQVQPSWGPMAAASFKGNYA